MTFSFNAIWSSIMIRVPCPPICPSICTNPTVHPLKDADPPSTLNITLANHMVLCFPCTWMATNLLKFIRFQMHNYVSLLQQKQSTLWHLKDEWIYWGKSLCVHHQQVLVLEDLSEHWAETSQSRLLYSAVLLFHWQPFSPSMPNWIKRQLLKRHPLIFNRGE